MIYLLLITIINNNEPVFPYFAKEYGNSPVFFVGFRDTNKYRELTSTLLKTTSVNLKFFLKKIKNDIDTFESLNKDQKNKVSFFLGKLDEHDKKLLFPKFDILELRKSILNDYKICIDFFGESSFFDLTVSTDIIATKMFTDRGNDYTAEIDNLFNRFDNSEWKGSPLLSSILLVQCNNLEYKQKYNRLLISARRSFNLMKLISEDENEDLFTNPIRFELSALNKSKKHSDAIKYFNKVGKKVLQSDRQIYSLAKIYSSVADSYFELGKLDLGESYQELALSKMHQTILDLEHPDVIAEAKKLYKMLEKQGKKEEMRKIEERYNLKKYP